MERQEIPIRFADLRRLAGAVPAYLAQTARADATPGLRVGVEEVFGMIGLDTEWLIEEFAKIYQVELTSFDFTGYISPENMNGCLLFLPIIGYLALGWLLKTAIGLLYWPFDGDLVQHVWQQPVPWFWLPARQDKRSKVLTAGDFVASAAVGRFVKREQVYFRLVA